MNEFEPVTVPGVRTTAERVRKFRETRATQGIPRTDRFNADGSRYFERRFIAWDGEGTGKDYTLFGWSDGREFGKIENPNGLGTREILEFIQSVADEHPQAIHVIYGGSYDFNHWMRDLDKVELTTVHKANKSGRHGFPTVEVGGSPVQLSVLMGKWFYFKLAGQKKGVKVFDVLSFFQCSFVKACDDYLTGKFGEATWYEREKIVYMKQHRDELENYSAEDVDYYNRAELVNLVRLADTLRDNCSSVNLVPDSWHGPAAIASKLFRDHKVSAHMSSYRNDDDGGSMIPAAVRRASRFAYAGGRAEMLKYGDIAGPVYEYDLCSAYPAAMQHLPSLRGGEWVHHAGNPQLKVGLEHFALYRVRWIVRPENMSKPGPLPFRKHDGSMVWPLNGETWVWWPEFDAAWRSEYADIKVLEAWVYTPKAGTPKPFRFVGEKYALRQQLKRQGDGGQFAIKLGLNSMYGKLAQQTGARKMYDRKTKRREWVVPRYHQIEWAGWVTSWCRARVFEAACQKPSATIAFATDAVFSLEPLNLDFGKGLGQWEQTVWDEFCNIQSGFYFGVVGGKRKSKSRGVDRRDDLPELIRGSWDERRVRMTKRGFVTLGLALASDARFKLWREWIDVVKDVVIGRTSKRKFDGVDARGMHTSHGIMTAFECRDCGHRGSHEFPIEWINPNPGMDRMKIARETNTNRFESDQQFTERDLETLEVSEDD